MAVHDRTIRSRLITSFVITVSVMCILLMYVMFSVSSIMSSVADSYRSNVALDEYSSVLLRTETSLETYMNVRSFESIDNYYTYRSKLDLLTTELHQKPSSDAVLFLEYKIMRMVHSFLGYADRALSARRANNSGIADQQYFLAEQTYSYLSAAVNELNALYFKRNIVNYTAKKVIFTHARQSCILLLLIVVCLAFLWIVRQVTTITRPLVEISKVANELAERNFDIPLFAVEARDEVGTICRAFNRMIVSIREYISTILTKAEEEKELREREIHMTTLYKDAQLKALQSQINPHFLFNTLNTGMQLAMMEGADRTSYFIEQTADFFRYNIQHQNRESTLGEEIALVDNYIYVMKVRFSNKFTFHKIVDSLNLSVPVPGMILQPLVEDCIRHGLSEAEKSGIITLHVYDAPDGSGGIWIDISDNGSGFPANIRKYIIEEPDLPVDDTEWPEKIKIPDIAESGKTSSGNGIGLRNVISRLRMFYKSREIFDIRDNTDISTGGTGTIFTIRIPHV